MEDKIYYVVNGKEITEKDVNEFIKQLGQDGMRFNSEVGKKQLAQELLNQELLLLSAKEDKLDETEEFNKELEFVKEQILKQLAMKKLISEVKVSDEEVKDFYENNKEQFKEVYSFKAHHILTDDEEKAKELKSKIDAGENFEDLAKDNSTCPSSQRGGDLGEFQSGQMVPEFENALMEMENGEISNPVKSQFGYHIIRLDDKKLVKENNFETFKDELKHGMLHQKQQEVYLSKVSELKEKYSVEEK
ncbi:peptidylprolyl isomerase [Helcococcus kunzii]|uniref:EpsD family peptidyl-prolyl cis-trans isomerase n=1 Tax=Helcococcus kunzii ATCC 51366 TaxID=883114 RepID=H3NNJ2_9FIRM|nr:peptidylprolyl isomerase [Helcococcus kunzii]EHR33967.1 EpsD family peptidyl-prolyl cis-trans isomerase [Helcococcus kunzii ATCC 51366]QZO77259.1 peptidylprolyl isomerase [Helcococcus kunzii]